MTINIHDYRNVTPKRLTILVKFNLPLFVKEIKDNVVKDVFNVHQKIAV